MKRGVLRDSSAKNENENKWLDRLDQQMIALEESLYHSDFVGLWDGLLRMRQLIGERRKVSR